MVPRRKASAVEPIFEPEDLDCPRPQLEHQLLELLNWVDDGDSPAAIDLLEAFARARRRAEGDPFPE